jgi:hypothetical protein
MAVEIKTRHDQPSPMQERANRRLRNSGGEEADTTFKTGEGPTRVYHNIHNPGSARKHGADAPAGVDVNGQKRDVV